jgi:hypothetical protein
MQARLEDQEIESTLFATPFSASRELHFAFLRHSFIMIREKRGLVTHSLYQIRRLLAIPSSTARALMTPSMH